jgi:outer membrane lipoprotein-sorting protein
MSPATFVRKTLTLCACIGLAALYTLDGGKAAAQGNGLSTAQMAVVNRVERYLNHLTSLQAEFMQVAPDGSISAGALYLARPGGRIRLEYAPPSQLLVVGREGWITLYDLAAEEDSRWPVRGTPFDVLIRDKVNLSKDVHVRRVDQIGGVIRLTVEGRDEPEAGSLTLVFSANPLELRQWQVIDAQRLLTTVTLADIQSNVALDSDLFVDKDPTLWGDDDGG